MVYVRLHGRLGNWMFQYAAALSLSKQVVAYTYDSSIQSALLRAGSLFDNLKLVDPPPSSIKVYSDENFCELRNVNSDVYNLNLNGYFQSERFFGASIARRQFAIPNATLIKIQNQFSDVLSKPFVTGIHVRRGDYLTLPFMHPFVGKKYLIDAIRSFPQCDNFIVCSDDISWCRMFFPNEFPEKHFYFSVDFSPVEDLYLLSLCKNNIISNSTFSWWAAWLNVNPNKIVIAPSMWFGFAHPRSQDIWNDLYFQGIKLIRNKYTASGRIRAIVLYSKKIIKTFIYRRVMVPMHLGKI